MDNKKEVINTLYNLKNMNNEERQEVLKKYNITKEVICDSLLTDPSFSNVPMKSLVINSVGKMNEEEFANFVAKNIDKVPVVIIKMLIKNITL